MNLSPETMARRIVCAANRAPMTWEKCPGLVIPGPRHFSMTMHHLTAEIWGKEWIMANSEEMEQGFINTWGEFLTRQEAWIVAEHHGQIHLHPSTKVGTLHSEDLY